MNLLNSILLEGTCASVPEIVATPQGNKCEFTVVYPRKEPDGMMTESTFDVEAFSRLGETIKRTVTKGRGLRIVGRITEGWTTDDAGKTHSRVKIIAEHVEFKSLGVAS